MNVSVRARQGVSIHVAMGFGGWHEVNTPQDLQRRDRDGRFEYQVAYEE